MKSYLDEAVGETRLVRVDAEGRFVDLEIERASEAGRRARAGEVRLGRIVAIEPRLGGAFVDLGIEPAGFLPFRQGRTPAKLHEGARVKVEVAAEAVRAEGKGPRLKRLPDAAETGVAPSLLSAPPLIAARAEDAVRGPEARRIADQAVEAALAREIALEAGGSIAIEPTRALIAVDVDAGARGAGGAPDASAPARLARATNLAALDALARHIRLRALSGLVVVDLLHMASREDRDAVRARMTARLAEADVRAEVGGVSRLGLLEIAVARRRRAIHEILCDSDGAPTPETLALDALRRLEDEAAADRGARLELIVPAAVFAWLEADAVGWRAELTRRIGARFKVSAASGARGVSDVRRL